MQFDLLTIFPNIFDSYLGESILRRAQINNFIKINTHNIRDYAKGKHRITDDKPYGGGAGMVMKVEPIYEAVLAVSKCKVKTTKKGLIHAKSQRIILLSASGEQFTQKKAQELTKYKQIILISGRYEGVDKRVEEYIVDEEISIGPYVLSGGELPSMVVVEAVARLLKGVLGNEESLMGETFSNFELPITYNLKPKTYPVYTRPEIFSPKKGINWNVPKILLSGNHKEIEKWRKNSETT